MSETIDTAFIDFGYLLHVLIDKHSSQWGVFDWITVKYKSYEKFFCVVVHLLQIDLSLVKVEKE